MLFWHYMWIIYYSDSVFTKCENNSQSWFCFRLCVDISSHAKKTYQSILDCRIIRVLDPTLKGGWGATEVTIKWSVNYKVDIVNTHDYNLPCFSSFSSLYKLFLSKQTFSSSLLLYFLMSDKMIALILLSMFEKNYQMIVWNS